MQQFARRCRRGYPSWRSSSSPTGSERADAAREQHFRLVDVAEPSHQALVQQRVGDAVTMGARAGAAPLRRGRSACRAASGPSFARPACFVRSRFASVLMNSATGMLKPDGVEVRRRDQHAHVARASTASAHPAGRCASFRSSACACAAPGRRRNASGRACRPTQPCRRSWPSAGDRRARASGREKPTRSGRRLDRRGRGAASPPRERWCRLQALECSTFSVNGNHHEDREGARTAKSCQFVSCIVTGSRSPWSRGELQRVRPLPKPWRIWKPMAEGLKPASTRNAASGCRAGSAVDLVNEQPEPCQRRGQCARRRRARRLVFREEREQLPSAAADVGGERAVDDDDERASRSCGRLRAPFVPPRFGSAGQLSRAPRV